ncbi:MAG: sulfotransferase [Anaerolineae bacterium]|nr:sulfotransferase [Anaerolineae bacterium]
MNETLRDRPIFLCGHPRSGTSLLRALFDGHPQVVVYPYETFFFRGFLPQAAKLNADQRIEFAARYLLHFFELRPEMADEFDVFPDAERKIQAFARMCLTVQQQIENYGYRHDGDLLAAVILAFGQVYRLLGTETRYWLEKSIFNEFFAEQIFDWWPDARCIHVMRDPRDVFVSYHPRRKKVLPRKFALRWQKSAEQGLANQRSYGDERYLIFTYEHLVQNPENALKELMDFLEIEYADTLKTPSELGMPWEGNSTFTDSLAGISAQPVARWKNELTLLETQTIEQITGRTMQRLDYVADTKPSLTSSWQILRGWLSYYRHVLSNIDPTDISGIDL